MISFSSISRYAPGNAEVLETNLANVRSAKSTCRPCSSRNARRAGDRDIQRSTSSYSRASRTTANPSRTSPPPTIAAARKPSDRRARPSFSDGNFSSYPILTHPPSFTSPTYSTRLLTSSQQQHLQRQRRNRPRAAPLAAPAQHLRPRPAARGRAHGSPQDRAARGLERQEKGTVRERGGGWVGEGRQGAGAVSGVQGEY